MKKQICTLTIAAVAVVISFSTGVAAPNTFDANGDLCVIGGTSPQEIGTPMELWPGAPGETTGTLVGYVTFDNESVIIDLSVVDNNGAPGMFPWVATAVHIHFADKVENIPHTNTGNPQMGQFEYNVEIEDPYQSVITIPVEFDAVGAIHLAVEKAGGLEGFEFYLPKDPVLLTVEAPDISDGIFDPSYLQATLSEAGILNGVYDAWCVDVDVEINPVKEYTAHVYSIYATDWLTQAIFANVFEYPENLPKINYLLNTFSAGDMVQPLDGNCTPITSCGAVVPEEALTFGDIQRAIWELIDDDQSVIGITPWRQSRVNAILCDVDVNGYAPDGGPWVPACGQKIAFIVIPDDGDVQMITGQSLLQEIGISCETEEAGSAWSDGKYGEVFPGSNQWGKYFLYDAVCGL